MIVWKSLSFPRGLILIVITFGKFVTVMFYKLWELVHNTVHYLLTSVSHGLTMKTGSLEVLPPIYSSKWYMRSGKKIRWIFIFLKKYLFIPNIYIVPFKVISLKYNTLVPVLFPILEALSGIVLSSSSDAVFISSIVANLCPFMGLFSFGNRKKGAKSGEYGG